MDTNTVIQEIAAHQADFTALLGKWNRLSTKARRREWNRYTEALDIGDAGWTRYAVLLINAWCEGFDPTGGLVQDSEVGLAPARAAAPA